MKRDFTNENFEDFLKRSADGLRMKAPDKVWQNLSKELGKKRRRFMWGLGALFLISGTAGYLTINHLSSENLVATQNNNNSTRTSTTKQTSSTTDTSPSRPEENRSSIEATNENSSSTAKVIALVPRNSGSASSANRAERNSAPVISLEGVSDQPSTENVFTPVPVDSYTEFDASEKSQKADIKKNDVTAAPVLPMTIESVVNSYRANNKKKRWESQFHFAPTISYRKLSENKSYLRNIDPNTIPSVYPAMYSSVNNNVTHKPDVGFELGLSAKYLLSDRLKVKAGVQFNVNRYDIRAFSAQMSNTTITLNSGGRIDSLNALSSYSTESGYKANWLQNFSFQVSAPVGVEYIISQNDKVQFGMATTIQPTYVLNDRSYLITSDYKNYTQVPWLIRRWNVNTAFETFVTYNSGKTKWQIGPQVRYQLLSSFISEYPVKENLFDFGLKVGISLNK